jgi:hypothetical protein
MTPAITHLRDLGFIVETETQLFSILSRGHVGSINAFIQNKGQLNPYQETVYEQALTMCRRSFPYRLPIPANQRTIQDVISEDGEPFPFVHGDPATRHDIKYRYPVNIGEIQHCRHPITYNMFPQKQRDQFERDFIIATFRREEGLIKSRIVLTHKQIKNLESRFGSYRQRDAVQLYTNYLRRYGLFLPLVYSQDSYRPDVNPFAVDSDTDSATRASA